ncbi:MAG: hypothetical protein Q8P07_05110, partial [bacterium]|nr:hypothetical protein [bacterium]
STFNNGIALTAGCFQMPNGSCLTNSGGDATTLDGIDSLSFLRSDTSDSFTSGTLTFNAGTNLQLSNVNAHMLLSTDANGNVVATSTPQVASINATSTTATSTFAGGLQAGGSTGLTVLQNGNVGIGTAGPTQKLEVNGNTFISGSNSIMFNNATRYINANGTRFIFATDDSAERIAFQTNSSEKMSILSGGNVGIGTTTPVSLLNVAGATAPKITLSDTDATTDQKHWFIESNGGVFAIGTTTDTLSTPSNRALTIDASGKVAIGVNDSGNAALHINSALTRNILITNPANGVAQTDGTYFQADSSGNFGIINQETGYLRFGTNGAEVGQFDSSGRLGIGTTTPSQTLSVQGNGLFSGDVSLANLIATGTIQTTGTATSTWANSGLSVAGGGLASSAGLTITGGSILNTSTATSTFSGGIRLANFNCSSQGSGGVLTTDSSGNIICQPDDTGGGGTINSGTTNRLTYYSAGTTLDSANFLSVDTTNGYLGIGTSTPWAPLSVYGNIVFDTSSIKIGTTTSQNLTVSYLNAATSTIANNQKYSFTLATSTTDRPIFRIDTSSGSAIRVATTSIIGGFNIDDGAFEYDSGSGITSIDSLNTGPMSFDTDAGIIGWIDLPISTTTENIVNSYSASIANIDLLTIYGVTNGSRTLTRSAVGIASSTPWGTLSVEMGSTSPAFVIADEGTSTPAFIVTGNGFVGLGTTTPGTLFSVQGIANFSTATSTFLSTGGINVTSGCVAIRGVCLGSGSGSGTVNSGTTNRLAYYTGSTAVSSAGFLSVDASNGYLGIGTSTPWAPLSVYGNIVFDTSSIKIGTTTSQNLTVSYLNAATTTIPNNQKYSFTFATSTTDRPIFRIDTSSGSAIRVATTSIIGGFNIDDGAFEYDSGSGITSIDSINTGPMAFDTDAGILSWVDLPSATTTAGLVNSYSAQIDSIPVFTIYGTTTTSGNILKGTVGIGTTTPPWTLTVQGGVCIVRNGGACPAAEVEGGLRVDTAGVASGDDPGDVFDIAERYPSNEAVEAGDIMAVDTATSSRASIKKAIFGETALGVVSTHPAIAINGSELILGATSEGTTTRPLVALVGRVPVKVMLDDFGTPIKKGDLITLSGVPGIGMKATTSGQTIGVALEDFSPPLAPSYQGGDKGEVFGKVMVFINLGYSKLDNFSDLFLLDQKTGKMRSSYSIDMDGKDIVNVRSILSQAGNWSIDENGKLTVKEIEVEKATITDELNVGTTDKPTGITIYDEVTGSPYCIKMSNGAMVTAVGKCAQGSSSATPGTTPAGSPTPTQSPTPTPEPTIEPTPEPTPTPTPTPEPTIIEEPVLSIPSEQSSSTESSPDTVEDPRSEDRDILDLSAESEDSGQIGTTSASTP